MITWRLTILCSLGSYLFLASNQSAYCNKQLPSNLPSPPHLHKMGNKHFRYGFVHKKQYILLLVNERWNPIYPNQIKIQHFICITWENPRPWDWEAIRIKVQLPHEINIFLHEKKVLQYSTFHWKRKAAVPANQLTRPTPSQLNGTIHWVDSERVGPWFHDFA